MLAQVSASCPLDLSLWLQESMGGRCASKYKSRYDTGQVTDTFVKWMAHVCPQVCTQGSQWLVEDKTQQEDMGYKYLDDIVARLMGGT